MSMVHLIKCQIIMVNLIKGQIRMVHLTKPYSFNIVNLAKLWPFVHFDQIFCLTFSPKCHFNQMYWLNVTCVFHFPNLYSKWTYLLVNVDTLVKLTF